MSDGAHIPKADPFQNSLKLVKRFFFFSKKNPHNPRRTRKTGEEISNKPGGLGSKWNGQAQGS